jgi:TorA maturation chaperone TorD
MTAHSAAITTASIDEEALRARPYRLLARFLAAPPDEDLLRLAGGFEGDGSELGRALGLLGRTARAIDLATARREYHDLFIGLGRGELVPFASFYLTGFLHEKPLARLRGDLARLGIARAPGNSDPEDHVAALCEVMAGLITGELGDGDLATQRDFFATHLEPWAERFFADLERAQSSVLYAPVGTFGRVFMGIETTAFAMG